MTVRRLVRRGSNVGDAKLESDERYLRDVEQRYSRAESWRAVRKLLMPLVVAIPSILGWQWYVDQLHNPLVPSPSSIAAVVPAVAANPDVWDGLASSDISLFLGFVGAVLVGVPLGLATGRFRKLDLVAGPLLDLALIIPMVVVMPVVLIALGLTRTAQVVIIFIFAITLVAVPCAAGTRAIPSELVEMAQSYGASELSLWRHVLIPGSLPAIVTGLRLGLGHAISGMVIVELTLLSIGIGNVIADYQSSFHIAEVFAVSGLIVVQSILLMTMLRFVEKRIAGSNRAAVSVESVGV